jgi:outer membrane protein TolC
MSGKNQRPSRLLARIALALLILAAPGCATVRQARLAQKAAAAPPGERTVTAAEAGLASTPVVTLEQAAALALRFHPAIAQARQNLVAAAAQVREARAAYGPTVDSSIGYRRGTSNTESSRGSNKSDDSYSASLSLDVLVYDFGKTPAAVRQARLQQAAAAARLRAAGNAAVYTVTLAYCDYRQALDLLRVAEDTVTQNRIHLEQTRALVEVGRRIRYDITKAELDLGNAQLDLIKASNAVTTAKAALTAGMGLAEDPPYRISEPAPPEIAGPLTDALRFALTNHPSLLALRARELEASCAVDAAIADLYPSLRLSGSYSWSGSGFPLLWNWAAAAQSALNLFDSGRKTRAIEAAAAQLRAARAAVAESEQQLALDLRRAYAQLESARQRVALSELLVRQARENLELIGARYRLGQASAVEQTDAQTALTQAQAEQVRARFDYRSALALIHYQTGAYSP